MKSERNNPWFKPWFNILLHTESIVCETVKGQCLEHLGYITLTGYRVSAAKMYLYHGSKIAKLDHIEQKFHKNYENLQKWIFLKTLLLSWKYHAQKKRPKICTGFRVNAAKIYLYHNTKIV